MNNTVCKKTLATGGEVFLLNEEQMPAQSQMAALLSIIIIISYGIQKKRKRRKFCVFLCII